MSAEPSIASRGLLRKSSVDDFRLQVPSTFTYNECDYKTKKAGCDDHREYDDYDKAAFFVVSLCFGVDLGYSSDEAERPVAQ